MAAMSPEFASHHSTALSAVSVEDSHKGNKMVRKKAVGRPPMKLVAKAAAVTPPNQLNLDFDSSAPAKQAKTRAKALRGRKAPHGIDIPEKPGG